MSYGIRILNQNNRVIIDEDNGVTVMDPVPGNLPMPSSGTNQGGSSSRYWRRYLVEDRPGRLMILQINSALKSYTYGHRPGSTWSWGYMWSPDYVIAVNWGNNPPPNPLPARYLIDSSDYDGYVGPDIIPYEDYGLRIHNASNGIVYDSSMTIASVTQAGILRSGDILSIPDGHWICVPICRSYLMGSGNSNYNWVGILRVAQGEDLWKVRFSRGDYYGFNLSDPGSDGVDVGFYFVVNPEAIL